MLSAIIFGTMVIGWGIILGFWWDSQMEEKVFGGDDVTIILSTAAVACIVLAASLM